MATCWLSPVAHAQLVSDGQTFVLDGITTNVVGGISVGTNDAYTLLVVTNGAKVNNPSGDTINTTGNTIIGVNASAQTNRIVVTGTNSGWQTAATIYVGNGGSACELDILNGAQVTNASAVLGLLATSSNNLAVVSGTNSTWTSTATLTVGLASSGNTLLVTNGGKINGSGVIGKNGSGTPGNNVVITGTNSLWYGINLTLGSNSVANAGSVGNNSLLIKNKGGVNMLNLLDVGDNSSSNILTVTDSGTLLQCGKFSLGTNGFTTNFSTGNQFIISNGAIFEIWDNAPAAQIAGTATTVTVTSGAMWTNSQTDLNFMGYSNALNITAAGKVYDNNGYIMSSLGTTVVVAGHNSLWSHYGNFYIDAIGSQLLITNGGWVVNRSCYLGEYYYDSNNIVLVSGANSRWTNDTIYLGYQSPNNQIIVSNLASVYTANLTIGGTGYATNNSLIVDGGVCTMTGNGACNVDGGSLTLNAGSMTGNLFFNHPSGRFVFNGGTLQTSYLTHGNGFPLVVGDGVRPANLYAVPRASITASAGLVVSSNALLNGVAAISGNVVIQSGGTFAPATNNPGQFVISGSLNLNSGSTTALNIYGTSIGSLTNLVYGGTLQLTNLGAAYADGQTFTLFQSTHYSGAFDKIIPAAPGPHLRWDTSELTLGGVLRIFNTNTSPAVYRQLVRKGTNQVTEVYFGIPYDFCYLLTTTNISDPMTNWTCIATNRLDYQGTILVTNPYSADLPARFFRMKYNQNN